MCTAGDVARGNRRQPEDEEEEDDDEEEEEEEEVEVDLEEEGLGQPETNMAPPLWPLPADVEEEDMATEATEDDFQIGYLQISDDPSTQNASDEREEVEEIAHNNSLPPVNGAVTEESNGHHAGSLAGAVVSEGRNPLERIVTVNGMQFHVYGNVSGLELLGANPIREEDLDIPDSEEEEEEERRRAETERAIAEANEADAARRAAPIPPERRAMIVNAMKGINLGGFRPSWADSVPEDQWINKVMKESSTSAPE